MSYMFTCQFSCFAVSTLQAAQPGLCLPRAVILSSTAYGTQ